MMIYWKYSSTRTFFLNEYWILTPSAILVNYLIIQKIRNYKEKIELLEKLKAQIELEKKARRMFYLSLGVNGYQYIMLTRGGALLDFVDVDYIKCALEQGLNYLDSERLKNIVINLYSNKKKGETIFITATALCHLADRYGSVFLALPFAVGDFGLTNVYQTLRKLTTTVLLGAIGPLYIIGSPAALSFAMLFGSLGLRTAFSNLDKIPTSPISKTDLTTNVKSRIPGTTEVVVVNHRNKLTMGNIPQKNQECWLPDQNMLNSNCKLKTTEVADAIDLVSPNLKYNEVVNMQDVTGLDRVEFSDVFDLEKAEICNPKSIKAKTVNFLEKFCDSGQIDESETWDITDSPVSQRKYLRTRNKN